MRSNKTTGFTMVELLVVIAIISILAALAIPQFAAFRTKSYNTAAETDLRNLKILMDSYYAEHDQYPAF